MEYNNGNNFTAMPLNKFWSNSSLITATTLRRADGAETNAFYDLHEEKLWLNEQVMPGAPPTTWQLEAQDVCKSANTTLKFTTRLYNAPLMPVNGYPQNTAMCVKPNQPNESPWANWRWSTAFPYPANTTTVTMRVWTGAQPGDTLAFYPDYNPAQQGFNVTWNATTYRLTIAPSKDTTKLHTSDDFQAAIRKVYFTTTNATTPQTGRYVYIGNTLLNPNSSTSEPYSYIVPMLSTNAPKKYNAEPFEIVLPTNATIGSSYEVQFNASQYFTSPTAIVGPYQMVDREGGATRAAAGLWSAPMHRFYVYVTKESQSLRWLGQDACGNKLRVAVNVVGTDGNTNFAPDRSESNGAMAQSKIGAISAVVLGLVVAVVMCF